MIRLLFLGLLLLQDPELDRLIQQLGDGDGARRDEAVRKIREIGPRARESLEKALKSTDPEIRARATWLLDTFERERLQSILEAGERKKVFPRITLHAADAPRRDVLADLARQAGWVVSPMDIPLDDKVTLKADNLPIIEALDQIGVEWRFKVYGEMCLGKTKPSPEAAVFDDGARFRFSRRTWNSDGKPAGTIFETQVNLGFDGDVQWSVASVKTDREWKVETCAIHSPRQVYVASAELANPRVTVKGTRLWFCPTPVEFANPKSGDLWRMGPCEVSVEWPSIRVRLDKPMEERLIKMTLTGKDIRIKVKPGRAKETMGVGVGGGGGGRYGGRFGGKNQAWCGCEGQPATKPRDPPPMAKEILIQIPFGEQYAVSDIATISITFHKPVEESFELISPPLK